MTHRSMIRRLGDTATHRDNPYYPPDTQCLVGRLWLDWSRPVLTVLGWIPGLEVAPDGTGCRQQILDGTGVEALHAARVLAMALQPYHPGDANVRGWTQEGKDFSFLLPSICRSGEVAFAEAAVLANLLGCQPFAVLQHGLHCSCLHLGMADVELTDFHILGQDVHELLQSLAAPGFDAGCDYRYQAL